MENTGKGGKINVLSLVFFIPSKASRNMLAVVFLLQEMREGKVVLMGRAN